MRLPCLSLRQPWAEFILDLEIGKDVENRRWNTRYRGPFLIHAAKGFTSEEYDYAVNWVCHNVGVEPSEAAPSPSELVFGGIVGAAVLEDVVKPGADNLAWHMKDQYGFLLDKPTRLPFRALRGLQRFFYVELTPEEERLLRSEGLISEPTADDSASR